METPLPPAPPSSPAISPVPPPRRGWVYIIRSDQTDKVYVGSTMTSLPKRMANHRCDYKTSGGTLTGGCSSRILLAYPDARIESLEEVAFHDRRELTAREGFHIDAYGERAVNRVRPGRTPEELRAIQRIKAANWRAAHPDYYRAWCAKNPDYQREYQREWRKANPDYHRQYREKRKAEVADILTLGS